MAESKAVARARADLAAGRTHQAVQRLRSLLTQDPNDLPARSLLASVYRRAGNLAEAGRWAYLSDDLRPEELAAFSRSQPSPWLRLRTLHWSGAWDALPSDAVRNRLRALAVAAEQYGPPPRPPVPGQYGPPPAPAVPGRYAPGRPGERPGTAGPGGVPRGRSARRRAKRAAQARQRAARAQRRAARLEQRAIRRAAKQSKFPWLYLAIILLVFTVLVLIGVAKLVQLVLSTAGG